MKIEQQTIGTVEILAPSAPLVDEDATTFCELLAERSASQSPRLVVALNDVPYMDSTALEGLLDCADGLSRRALGLRLVGVNPTCREVLEITGIARHFRFFEDVQDAVRSFM
ncbi:MAG: STAS domain-containing protein [Phycisphaerae bacterium]